MSKAEKAMRNSRPHRRDSGRRCYSYGGYMVISKQPVHLGDIMSGAPLLVVRGGQNGRGLL